MTSDATREAPVPIVFTVTLVPPALASPAMPFCAPVTPGFVGVADLLVLAVRRPDGEHLRGRIDAHELALDGGAGRLRGAQLRYRLRLAGRVQRPLRVIVHADANVGLATAFFAHAFPEALIVAIEPEAHSFALLARNVAGYPKVIAVKAALWHANTMMDLFDPGLGHWGYVAGPSSERAGRSHQCTAAVTLEHVMEVHGLDCVDLLKMDIEGSEREVLGTAAAWLPRVDALIVELHERKRPGCRAAFARVAVHFEHRWQGGELEDLARGGAAVVGPARALEPRRARWRAAP